MSRIATFPLTEAQDATPDRELIDNTLAGDQTSFAILVTRFQRKVYRVAFAIVRDEAEADTITQDTFIQAFTNLAKFEGRAELETWLTRISINRSRDTLRRRRLVGFFRSTDEVRENGELALDLADNRPDPERLYLATQLRAAIQRAEMRLSPQQLTIFRLRHYENLPLEEIAGSLGLKAGTVRAHLFRAVHKIRKELAAWRGCSAAEELHEISLH